MKRVFGLFVIMVFLILSGGAEAKKSKGLFSGVHTQYRTQYIKTIDIKGIVKLRLEKASIYPDKRMILPFTRYQFRDEYGNIVAYTPTRGQAIHFCPSSSLCWIFMWKTVYPLPAIFQLDTNPDSWISDKHPPMKYSRSGNDGYGFNDITDPITGLFGLGLFFMNKIWYFVILIILSALLVTQIAKFHDLPDERKRILLKMFVVLNTFLHSVLPIDPYTITVAILILYQFIGVLFWGIPITHTFLISIAAFLWAAVRIGKLRSYDR